MNDNAVAEILKAIVLAEHGVAWLPESLIRRELDAGLLCNLDVHVTMDIRLYRSEERTRQAVSEVLYAARGLLA